MSIPQIFLNQTQLQALAKFFGGFRDRPVTVYQEIGTANTRFCIGSVGVKEGYAGKPVSFAEVQGLLARASSQSLAGVALPAVYF
jgi:hypothetical protein